MYYIALIVQPDVDVHKRGANSRPDKQPLKSPVTHPHMKEYQDWTRSANHNGGYPKVSVDTTFVLLFKS